MINFINGVLSMEFLKTEYIPFAKNLLLPFIIAGILIFITVHIKLQSKKTLGCIFAVLSVFLILFIYFCLVVFAIILVLWLVVQIKAGILDYISMPEVLAGCISSVLSITWIALTLILIKHAFNEWKVK